MQTLWDGLQQLIRIVLYVASGWLLQKGFITDAQTELFIGGGLAVATGLWTVFWNRQQVVTVDGVTAASKDASSPVTKTTLSQIEAAKAGVEKTK